MPGTDLAQKTKMGQAITNVSVRESIAKLKKSVLDAEVFEELLFVAKTGNIRRQKYEDGKPISDAPEIVEIDEASQLDILKFLLNKVVPNARATEDTGDAEQLQKWAEIIQGETRSDSEGETIEKTEKTP